MDYPITPPEKPKRNINPNIPTDKARILSESFVNQSFSSDSEPDDMDVQITRHFVDQTTSICFEGLVQKNQGHTDGRHQTTRHRTNAKF